jgi:uncharacterized protein YggE
LLHTIRTTGDENNEQDRIIALLAVSLIACTTVHTSPGTESQVAPTVTLPNTPSGIELEAVLEMPATLPSGEEVNLRFTLINSTDTRLYVLKWYTPLEGIGGEIFRVEYDGQTLPYEGILAYRTSPSPEAYIALDAGESVSAEVDLAEAYDFSRAGEYTIEFISPRISHVARTESEMAKEMADLGPVEMPSNRITVNIEHTSTPRRGAPPVEDQNSAHLPGVPRTITVVGVGKISLQPDMATVSIGVETRASTVSEAKAEVDVRMAAVVAALQEAGIAEKDIQTSQYSIHYEREPLPMLREGPVLKDQDGYRVSNVVRVTVRDVERAGAALDVAVEAGANQVWGVNLTVSDEDKWQGQAREKAMSDARARAGELASLAGVELGEVLSISEVIGATPVPMMVVRSGMGGGGGIAPGELEMATQIQVTFAIQ